MENMNGKNLPPLGTTAHQQQQQNQIKNGNSPVRTRKTWPQLKTIVEFSRKLISLSNSDIPSNINFREQSSSSESMLYFLGGTNKRDITIKYLDLKANSTAAQLNSSGVEQVAAIARPLFEEKLDKPAAEKQQLTKEQQLLRERKRCSSNGITSFCLDNQSARLVFSENSELFYFDDSEVACQIQQDQPQPQRQPVEIRTSLKGPIDVQICPLNANLISYVLNDNLYVQDVRTRVELQLTHTSEPIKSGSPSYAVQEEFNRYTGYWWQPVRERNEEDESNTYRIVYEQIDDTQVDLIYIAPSCEDEFGCDTYRYPKAGRNNSKIYLKMIEITVFDDFKKPPVVTQKRMHKSFYELFNWYEYLARAGWTPNGEYFWTQIYDRLQMHSAVMLIPADYFVLEESDPSSEMQTSSCGEAKHVFILHEQISNVWINFHNTMHFLNEPSNKDENQFSFITALEETGFLHLYHFKCSINQSDLECVSEGVMRSRLNSKCQLTDGDWCIDYDDNVCVDEPNRLIYFTAYKDPLESHLFVMNYTEPNKVRQLTTSGFSHKISMNKKCNYFITICSNLSTPYKTYLFEIRNQTSGNINSLNVTKLTQLLSREEVKPQPIVDVKNNNALKSNYATVNSLLGLNLDSFVLNSPLDESSVVAHLFKPPQIFTFMTEDNCKLYGMIYMPFNYEQGSKYPTVQYVYGGPKVQIVSNSYKANKYSRFNILALLGYCVVVIDSRGSDYRGQAFESHLNRKMGTVEISDQVKGLESACKIFNCIDAKRIAIFGWSYGGYMSLMGLAQRPDIFKVAISGAPVTSWALYDTAYTERYMGLPDENKVSYDKGSVLSWAKYFPDEENRLLIIHGMIDENVHFVHTRKLVDALIKENKPYQLQIYPNERHGIRSSEASVHCDVNLYSFLEQHL